MYVLRHAILHVQHVNNKMRMCQRSMCMPMAIARTCLQLYEYAIISEHADVYTCQRLSAYTYAYGAYCTVHASQAQVASHDLHHRLKRRRSTGTAHLDEALILHVCKSDDLRCRCYLDAVFLRERFV